MGFLYILRQNKWKHKSIEIWSQNICMIASLKEILNWIFEKNYEDLMPQKRIALYCIKSVEWIKKYVEKSVVELINPSSHLTEYVNKTLCEIPHTTY